MFEPGRHVRQNTLDFKPPLPRPLVQKLFKMLMPWICNQVLKGLSIEIDAASLERLKAIRGQRCLILPNHPSEWDPCPIFEVARRLDENFFYVVAREVFDYDDGMRGWILQHLGCYSLIRGANDRKSLKTSIDILSQNKGRLVIFIEGEISSQNETLLPLEAGVIQLAFMALSELYKENGKNADLLPSLYICPVGLRYIYQPAGLEKAIEHAMTALEKAVGLPTDVTVSHYERLKAISGSVLSGAAGQLGYQPDPDAPLGRNVSELSALMLTKLEQIVNIPTDNDTDYLTRIRQIRNTVDRIMSQGGQGESSAYAKRLFQHQKAILRNFYEDLDRVVNFIAIYEGYLQPDIDANRIVELLRRLEKEVFGQFRLVHPRTAHVSIQKPIDLKTCFPAFLSDRREVVNQLAMEVERKIYAGIHAFESQTEKALATGSIIH